MTVAIAASISAVIILLSICALMTDETKGPNSVSLSCSVSIRSGGECVYIDDKFGWKSKPEITINNANCASKYQSECGRTEITVDEDSDL